MPLLVDLHKPLVTHYAIRKGPERPVETLPSLTQCFSPRQLVCRAEGRRADP